MDEYVTIRRADLDAILDRLEDAEDTLSVLQAERDPDPIPFDKAMAEIGLRED